MKIITTRISLCSLLIMGAWLGSALHLRAQTVTVDPGTLTYGYMNWAPMPGDGAGYGGMGSSVWALADLRAYFSGTNLTLQPNTNKYAPGNNTWVNANGSGANRMDANIYNETTGTYVATTLTFTYDVVTNTLSAPYSSQAFIKDFTADYSANTGITAPLNAGVGSISYLISTNAEHHIQYGFETFGPDANPATAGALGSVVVTPVTVPVAVLPANDLINPGFELDGAGVNQNFPGWHSYGPNVYSETSISLAHSGANYFKVYQDLANSSVNYNGAYQDYISGPGATYSASGWAYTLSSDQLAGQNTAWIEVTFRDAGANVLALYRSALITTNSLANGSFPINTWIDLSVTNQYNPNTHVVTNTVSQLVAPAGTYFIRYQIVYQGDGKGTGGSMYFDDLYLAPVSASPYGNWNIVWSDEFNGTNINPATWTYDLGNGGSNPGWGNNELEYYTSRTNNAYVAGGLLHIVAQKELTIVVQNNLTNSFTYTSARMKSQGLFSCQYGRLEWRARMPAGIGSWPALWLLGTNIDSISWPGCGEIDVMENNGGNLTTVQGSLHSGSDETAIYTLPNSGAVTSFHTYTLDWSTNAFLYYVDGHLYETQTNWGSSTVNGYPFPFNQPFFFIMNLAIGGNYVGNPSTNTINAGMTFPAEMQVDYVRIYRQTAPLNISLSYTNGNWLVSWPSNIVAHVQAQFNPLNGSLGANWSDLLPNSNPVVIYPTNGSSFYRLQSP